IENKEKVEAGYPADFIAESIEMTRAWFYVLHVLATGLTKKNVGLGEKKPAFKNAIASGLIFAENGEKLSKKLKNYPEIGPVLEKYGADVLRFYLLSSTALGEPYKFSEKDMRQVQRNVYLTLWNVYSMFTRYAKVHEFVSPPYEGGARGGSSGSVTSSNSLDQWIIARTHKLVQDVSEYSDAYRIDQAAKEFITYIDDLSNWYVRRSRTRLQHPKDDTERDEVFGTLYSVLVTVTKTLAPFMPFVAEDMYKNLTGEASVHLQDFAVAEKFDDKILERTQLVRDLISQALAERAAAKIKVRQPLLLLELPSSANGFSESDLEMIQEEVNVKKVSVSDKAEMRLDTEITPELKSEGTARDIIRHGQGLRKTAGFALDDRITLLFVTEDTNLQEIVDNQKEYISTALQADSILVDKENFENISEINLDGAVAVIGVKKV
ncbi:MAG: class I tRNA ligase family protein, partial [Candidatus Andersenbacteria bacterium]